MGGIISKSREDNFLSYYIYTLEKEKHNLKYKKINNIETLIDFLKIDKLQYDINYEYCINYLTNYIHNNLKNIDLKISDINDEIEQKSNPDYEYVHATRKIKTSKDFEQNQTIANLKRNLLRNQILKNNLELLKKSIEKMESDQK